MTKPKRLEQITQEVRKLTTGGTPFDYRIPVESGALDPLINEYIRILQEEPLLAAHLWFDSLFPLMGEFGDKFASSIENMLGYLPTKEIVAFYSEYIISYSAEGMDIPNDKQKFIAVQYIKELISASEEEKFHITDKSATEIKRLDPATYDFLIKEGKIIID